MRSGRDRAGRGGLRATNEAAEPNLPFKAGFSLNSQHAGM